MLQRGTKEYPLIASRDVVIFPKMALPMIFKRPQSQAAIREALGRNRLAVIALQKKKLKQIPTPDNLYSVGTLVKILESHKLPDGAITAIVEGKGRVKIEKFIKFEPFLQVRVQEIPEIDRLSLEGEALMHTIEDHFKKCVALGMSIPLETLSVIFARPLPSEKADLIADFISRKLEVLQVAKKIEKRTAKELGKAQKEIILREQLKAIQQELGAGERADIAELRKKIERVGMPAEAKKLAEKELNRLMSIPSFSPEISYIRTYLEWLTDLPWSKTTEAKLDMKRARKILDEDHYGLEDVKERMLEYLAVCKLAKKLKGPILCFVGPPGTGKTSVGKSIARALGRKFIRMSLGGIRDEAEIRGHRRTYVGALPGRIIQGLKTAGTRNPVFMLDEIDKVGADFRGDPSSALLEALDPEQNHSFSDHYIEIPFDLSDVMFITTANILDPVPPALKDRMEVVEFPGYTEEEKFHIAKKFLIPKLIQSHGLNEKRFKITDEATREIISEYTREAGVRNLEREIAKICRKTAKKITENKKVKKIQVIGPKDLHEYLGAIKFRRILAEKKDEVGVTTALAWTQSGGEILFVESTKMPGKGRLILTGHLGDVMKESAQAAFSYTRSRARKLKIKKDFYKALDLHVHVPAGAIPKDGPSAGVAMAASLISCLTDKLVRREVGMTGEVTLRGKVLEIGGVKEKVLAAHRAGLKKIILPFDNKKDLEKLPEKVKKDLRFTFVKHMDEVLKIALKSK
jgi:ATP-dependent Lon protease